MPEDLTGRTIGTYQVTAKLGAGGMGEVWRAHDARLERDVALKVLPAAFTEDPERLARFEREARLLAQLHHPHIASIFGLEESDGVRALVMELVEGPTLAERLEAGRLSLEESLAIARQIAEALETAHEKGIIHRDLKPQNVKAAIDGKVKVLDFGLAKAMDPEQAASGAPSVSQLAHSPTLTLGATVQGMILGTAAYMAPEQARGGNVDRRADVWAFGVVLYEMLSGETLFAADTVPDTLARVLTREIDLSKLPESAPPAIRRLIRRCLVRSPKDRLHSIADARIVLDDVLAGRIEEAAAPAAAESATAPRSLGARLLPWIGGALAGLLIGGFAISRWAAGPAVSSVGEARMQTLVSGGPSGEPSMAPDGRTLAFTSFRNGEVRVWIKDLASGSESALGRSPSFVPVFSPDGTSVLFGRNEGRRQDLYRIALATREERLVARAAINGSWSPDGGSVIYVRQPESGAEGAQSHAEIVEVELGSGKVRTLFSGEIASSGGVAPLWSPDGRWIVIAILEGQAGVPHRIGMLDPKSGKLEQYPIRVPRVAVSKLNGAAWVSPRRLALLLADGGDQPGSSGRIATFDLESREVRSLLPLQPVGSGIAVAGPGSVVVSLASLEQSLYELRRGADGPWGNVEPRTEGPYADRQPAYSPDGRWILFSSNRSGNIDLWRLNRDSGELQRLTDHEAQDWDPATSPDGRQLLFSSNRSGSYQIWMAEADGSSPRQVTDVENAQNPTMTADGEWIVFSLQGGGTHEIGIWKIRPDGRDLTLVRKTANAFIPEVSPDGRFAVYNGSGGEGARIVRIADGELVPLSAVAGNRFRWSVEGGRTWLWAIVPTPDETTIRRFAFDPVRGVVGEGEIMLPADLARDAESLGVARDGSAFTFSRTASVKTQIIRIDGLDELDAP